jgi:hypothetical protein
MRASLRFEIHEKQGSPKKGSISEYLAFDLQMATWYWGLTWID